jgi:hypothetical protein
MAGFRQRNRGKRSPDERSDIRDMDPHVAPLMRAAN